MSYLSDNNCQSHPFLFLLLALSSVAELGLTVFLIDAGNETNFFVGQRYHALLIILCFNSAWTVLFSTAYVTSAIYGGIHILAHVASSVFWLALTAVFWGVGAGIMSDTRTGGQCPGRTAISRCRQSLTVEALGWTSFSLCTLILLVTLVAIATGHLKPSVKPDAKPDATV